jgi:hypothetical protein
MLGYRAVACAGVLYRLRRQAEIWFFSSLLPAASLPVPFSLFHLQFRNIRSSGGKRRHGSNQNQPRRNEEREEEQKKNLRVLRFFVVDVLRNHD